MSLHRFGCECDICMGEADPAPEPEETEPREPAPMSARDQDDAAAAHFGDLLGRQARKYE